jgi:hypothetical protein
MVAVAIIGAGVIGAGATAYGASKAADAQGKASQAAIAAEQAQQAQNRADTLPFRTAGESASNQLVGRLPELTSPFAMTQENLEATPGYQFNLSQGLKATQNSAAARGLGLSGAAFKGAATFATGLADSTYKSQFDMDQANKTNAYTKLLGVSSMGANAATGTATNNTFLSNAIGNNLTGAGNAQAAAYMTGANGIASGVNSIANGYMQNQLLNGGMYGNAGGAAGGFGGYASLGNGFYGV